jgi:CBS domain-containing protein
VRSPLELPLYFGLGLGASLISFAYTQARRFAKECFAGTVPYFRWLAKIPQPIHPVIGGALVGIAALKFPQILGIGYGTIQAMLQDAEISMQLLLSLLAVKLVVTAISAGSGLVGGVFAPAMFLGAAFGGAYAKILVLVAPATIGEHMAASPAYAMVGMAAVLAASVRAPLTSILLLFELTRDYRIVLPLMAAVGLSFWLVEMMKPNTNSNSNLQQIGLSALKDEQIEILQQILVEDAMQTKPKKLPATMNVLEAALEMWCDRTRSALVIDAAEQLIGIVSLEEINRALFYWQQHPNSTTEIQQDLSHQTIIEISTTDILYAYNDEPLCEALDRMAVRGLHQLPVVARGNHECILGLLEREQIALTCDLAVMRKALRHYLSVPSPTDKLIQQMPIANTHQSIIPGLKTND